MTTVASQLALAAQARRTYIEALARGMGGLSRAINEAAAQLLLQRTDYAVMVARRDGAQSWARHSSAWAAGVISGLRHAAVYGPLDSAGTAAGSSEHGRLALVDDGTIELEITASRLALAMMDKATWEFTDLRTRMRVLEQQDDLSQSDLLRANVVAKLVLDAWTRSGLTHSDWQLLRAELHEEFSQLLGEAYHEVNHTLLAQGVLPEVDLRPFIRRATQISGVSAGKPSAPLAPSERGSGKPSLSAASNEVAAARSPASGQAEEVLHLLQRIVGRQVPSFAAAEYQAQARPSAPSAEVLPTATPAPAATAPLAPRLTAAIKHAQDVLQQTVATAETTAAAVAAKVTAAAHKPADAAGLNPSTDAAAAVVMGGLGATIAPALAPQLLEELKSRNQAFKQVLKQAADTPAERATIEVVAMMFQSILMEERILPSVRVWFARLQMPVLRVAVSEPDFFATTDHPARLLIDRMGACVMGFSGASPASGAAADPLEREIKRVVQVVEAYPDTGRRVFQTVLAEFEKFLDNYFKNENQASRKGVSLAQQVEQRETLAIQYTIELRKMLEGVPVQDGVREFLFQVWAEVLAVTAVRAGAQSDATRLMKRVAADLIWSASAKVTREERAEVIRRLPPLLKTLRDGMGQAGIPLGRQDEHVRGLNNALAAAFTAKTAVIPRERIEELMDQLERLEALLPAGEGESEINDLLVRDLSGHEAEGMEVVAEGGSAPTPAMLAWARELQVGSWYMLDYRNRNEAVQLAWRGTRRQIALFVSPKGRGVLFPLGRLAAFLQAGLLLPAQDEALTVKATRNALAKLDVDPSRLLS
jgi:hypothetical protein